MDYKAVAHALFVEVERYVGTRVNEIASTLEALQGQIKDLSSREQIPGPPGKDGRDGTNGVDGKSFPIEDAVDFIKKEFALLEAALPIPKNGINGKDGAPGPQGLQGEKGIDGRDGREGPPGRDAVHIDVIDGIDPLKKYQRGTFASFRGGIVRSFRATDQMPADGELEKHGWHVVVRGIDRFEVEADADLRQFTARSVLTDGQKIMGSFRSPTMAHRGIWKDDAAYLHGDVVTSGGSMWLAEKDSPQGRPGNPGSDWKLIVKKGRDGADK